MFEIVNVLDFEGGTDAAARFYHEAWSGIHYRFYLDAMQHSSGERSPLPRFFLLLKHGRPVGCYGLAANDFISRHDLWPWFVALYIEEAERGKELGGILLEHALEEAAAAGFPALYLTTDHDGYYEKYGWSRIEDGYERDGAPARIYTRATRLEHSGQHN